MTHLTVTLDGITFFDGDVPDNWDLAVARIGGGVKVDAVPVKANPIAQFGEAMAANSRRKTDQKRAQLEAVEEA